MADGVRASSREASTCAVCELCGSLQNLLLCARCRGVWYCSKEHQRSHWRAHKAACKKGKTAGKPPVSAPSASASTPVGLGLGGDNGAGGLGVQSGDFTAADWQQFGSLSLNNACSPGAGPLAPLVSTLGKDTLDETTCTFADPASHLSFAAPLAPTQAYSSYTHASTAHLGLEDYDNINLAGFTALPQQQMTPSRQPRQQQQLQQRLQPHSSSTDHLLLQRDTLNQTLSTATSTKTDPLPHLSVTATDFSSSTTSSCSSYDHSYRDNQNLDLSQLSDLPLDLAGGSGSVDAVTMRNPTIYSDPRLKQVPALGTLNGRVPNRAPGSDSVVPPQPSIPTPKRPSQHDMMRRDRNANVSSPESEPDSAETKLADYVVKCLNDYGICVVDHFLGEQRGTEILDEVRGLYEMGDVFRDGELVKVNQKGDTMQKIRGDKITWMEKDDPGCNHIGTVINKLDKLMISCNGRLGSKNIHGRTKAMVACYPGGGTGYKRHVDNPHGDGRCITCIYYLNKNWDTKYGGILRIFPVSFKQIADIEPKFDRLLFFWSDRRNPHEVQPSFRTRFAVTVWYFDRDERDQARKQSETQGTRPLSSLPDAATSGAY